MKKRTHYLLLFIVALLGSSPLFADTVTQYYSAPFGNFDRIRLIPRAEITPTSPCDEGVFYSRVDEESALYQCSKKSSITSFEAFSADSEWATKPGNRVHTKVDTDNVSIAIGLVSEKFTLSNNASIMAIEISPFFNPINTDKHTQLLDPLDRSVFFWYSRKAALRAAFFESTQLTDDTIGIHSIGFGYEPIMDSAAEKSSILGGDRNGLLGATHSSILGGSENLISSGAHYSFIGGGQYTHIYAPYSFVGGGSAPAPFTSGIASGSKYSTIIGGQLITIDQNSPFSTIGGGDQNKIGLNSRGSFIGGGERNDLTGNYSTIGGGASNAPLYGGTRIISSDFATSVGGQNHQITSSYSTILGGNTNRVIKPALIEIQHSSIGGGIDNAIGTDGSTIVGGNSNYTPPSFSNFATIGGGDDNTAAMVASFVGGGATNYNSGRFGVIFGGSNHRIIGTGGSPYPGQLSVIGGGARNTIRGSYSVIMGGLDNTAEGDYSWVAGDKARGTGDRSFFWGSAHNTAFDVTPDDTFILCPQCGKDSGGNYTGLGAVGINDPKPSNREFRVAGRIHLENGSVFIASPNDAGNANNALINSVTGQMGRDLAERFPSTEILQAGDLVVVANTDTLFVEKSTTAYDKRILGVVSASPALLFEGSKMEIAAGSNNFKEGKNPPVALTGQVKVKVSLENGPIKYGDLLTSSSTPGHAMKADRNLEKSMGKVVGKALTAFSGGENGETTGTVVVLVSLH